MGPCMLSMVETHYFLHMFNEKVYSQIFLSAHFHSAFSHLPRNPKGRSNSFSSETLTILYNWIHNKKAIKKLKKGEDIQENTVYSRKLHQTTHVIIMIITIIIIIIITMDDNWLYMDVYNEHIVRDSIWYHTQVRK